MISKKEYKRISSGWNGKVYQKWPKMKKRLPLLERNLEFFRGAKVLEVGANAGIYGWHIAKVAQRYIAVERNKSYFVQLLQTMSGIDNSDWLLSDFEKLKLDAIDFDLFLASYVLHHFSAAEMIKLIRRAFVKCSKVAIFTRSGDPCRYGHGEVGRDPIPVWEGSYIKKELDLLGYKSSFHFREESVYDGIYLILAEKI